MIPVLTAIVVVVILGLAYVWYTRKVWFYRDPDHGTVAQDSDVVLSPVYGVVAYIKKVKNGQVVSDKKGEDIAITDIAKTDWPSDQPGGDGWLIGIAMTALDVHYQYAPLPCQIKSIYHYQTGMNLPMFDLWEYVRITWLRQFVQLWAKRYVLENERQTFWIQGDQVKAAVILIADKFVDKITTYVHEAESAAAGAKLSFISRGSQVDVLICGCPELEVMVHEGQPVKGPLTQLARLRKH